jgi:hypothetical protein
MTPNGQCCDPRQVKNGRCEPPPSTCPPGSVLTPNGQCCDPKQVKNGRCEPPPPDVCPPGQVMRNGHCVDVPKRTIRRTFSQVSTPGPQTPIRTVTRPWHAHIPVGVIGRPSIPSTGGHGTISTVGRGGKSFR